MNITLQSDAMRELISRLDRLLEADANTSILGQEPQADNTVPTAEPKAAAPAKPQPGTEDQPQDDAAIDSVMTEPKDTSDTSNKKEKITLASLAGDLGIENTQLFKTAFNSLRSGTEPTDPQQLKELAAAFTKLMSTDTSTVQKVVNRLRMIYKKPLPSSEPSA